MVMLCGVADGFKRAVAVDFRFESGADENPAPRLRLLLRVKQTFFAEKQTSNFWCRLSGVLRLGKRMKFGGLGWPPR